jgi:HK97 family phage portal protein
MIDRVPSVTASAPPTSMLTRVASAFGIKAQGAPEGATIQQPAARVFYPDQGFIPMTWPLNFWQTGYNVMSGGENTIVEACVWAYIRAIAQLPGYHRRRKPNNGVETVTTTALARLLRFPNIYETRSDFLTHTVRSLLYEGNSYWLAWPRNERNEPTALHWCNPRNCRPYVAETGDIFYSIGDNPVITGDLEADLRERVLVPQRDVLHIKLATPRDPLIGETWLTSLAFDLANRGAMNMNISAFYNNMSRPSGVLSTEQILTAPQVEELRKRWNDQSAGLNAGGVPILTAGLKWQAVSLNANDSQLIEALKMNDRTIAGVFGVPGILIGLTEDAAWASTEALMNFWLANGLGFLLDHIEVAIDQFFGLPANEYTEYDTDALLRTAYKDRVEALKSGVTGGIYAPNEARAREGLPEVKGGEEPRVQQQQVPLSFASLGSIPPVGGQPTTPSDTPPAPATAAPTDASPDGENAPDAADEPSKDIPDVDFEVLGAQVRLLIEHHHDP